MSFSGQYASFTPDPELNKREWYNERGGYIMRSRYYPVIERKEIIKEKKDIKEIKQKRNELNNNLTGGYIKEDRMAYNQPSNFIDFLNYYFKNLLR